jgi:hypothetical protein
MKTNNNKLLLLLILLGLNNSSAYSQDEKVNPKSVAFGVFISGFQPLHKPDVTSDEVIGFMKQKAVLESTNQNLSISENRFRLLNYFTYRYFLCPSNWNNCSYSQ